MVAPPKTGVTVGYIPAGTYTLHQVEAPKGYTMAADQKITVKDSCQVNDMQQIVVVNTKVPDHVHIFSDVWSKDDTFHWHAATCEHTELVNDDAFHTFGQWHVIKDATTEMEGLQERERTACGFTQQEKIDKLPPAEKPEIPTEQPEVPTEQPEIPTEEPMVEKSEMPTAEPGREETKPKPEDKPVTPQTGDVSQVLLWAAAALTSGGAGIALNTRKKRR